MNKKKNNQWLPVIILILVIGIAGAISLPGAISSMSRSTSKFFDLPRISVTYASSDGEAHYMQTDLSVAIDKSKASQVDAKALAQYVTDIVKSLDYQSITSRNSTDYIKEQVAKGLEQEMDLEPEDLQGVYISSLQTGNGPAPASSGTNEKNSNVLRSLFKNIN